MLCQTYKSFVIITVLICAFASVSHAAKVVSIVLCQDVTEEGGPVAVTETFSPDTPQIQALVTVEEADAGALVKGTWVSIDAIETPNYTIDEAEAQFESAGGGTIYFSVTKPASGWPTGNYRIDVSINGQMASSASFKIVSEADQPVPEGSQDASASEQATSDAELSPEDQEKLQALEAARQAGILNEEEYNRKKNELMQEAGGTTANTTHVPNENMIIPPPLPPTGHFYQTSRGVSFWCPPGWTIQEKQDKLQLLPANPSSIADAPAEYYFLNIQQTQSKELQNLNSPLVLQYVQAQMESLSSLLKPESSPTSIKAQNGVGLIYNWESDILKGLGITLGAKAYVGYANNCFMTLVGFGPKELIQAREQELNQVFASLGASGLPGGPPPVSVPPAGSPQANTGGNTGSGSVLPPAGAGVLIDLGPGLKLQCPAGWQPYQEPERVILRHGTIPGTIVILIHTDTTLQQVQANMQIGISEPTARLTPVTAIQMHGSSAVAADYSGMVDGQPMKARGIGTFSPNGGAYIIAMAPPNQYGQPLASAAASVAAGLQYTQVQASPQASNLVQHFAGPWWSYNEGATQTAYLSPDGRFSDSYEYSAHVENTDQYGNVSSTGDVYNQEGSSGRWSVRGDINRGVLTIMYNDGTQDVLNYQVHVANGQTYYSEYYFEGQLWSKGSPP